MALELNVTFGIIGLQVEHIFYLKLVCDSTDVDEPTDVAVGDICIVDKCELRQSIRGVLHITTIVLRLTMPLTLSSE